MNTREDAKKQIVSILEKDEMSDAVMEKVVDHCFQFDPVEGYVLAYHGLNEEDE